MYSLSFTLRLIHKLAVKMFPSSIIANIFNFVPATMFEVSDDSEREVVKIEF